MNLDDLAALEAKATPAPWIDDKGYRILYRPGQKTLFEQKHLDGTADDGALVVALRNAFPALLAELRAGRTLREEIMIMGYRGDDPFQSAVLAYDAARRAGEER